MASPMLEGGSPAVATEPPCPTEQASAVPLRAGLRSALPIGIAGEDLSVQADGDSGGDTESCGGGLCARTVSITVFLVFHLFILVNMIQYPLRSSLRGSPVIGLSVACLMFSALALLLFSLLRIYVTPPGPVPRFMSAASVDEHVREAVRRTCARELGTDFDSADVTAGLMGDGASVGAVDADDVRVPMDGRRAVEGMPVNAVVTQPSLVSPSALVEVAAGSGNGHRAGAGRGGAESGTVSETDDDDDDDDDDEETEARRARRLQEEAAAEHGDREAVERRREQRRMARRRRVRQRYGLPVYSLGRVALEAHLRLRDGTPSEQAEVVGFLLERASLCARCGYYATQTIAHCKSCGQCYLGYYRHCSLLGTCIARENHKYYILAIVYDVIFSWLGVGISIFAVSRGYSYFFRVGDVNMAFYLSFCCLVSHGLISLILLVTHVFEAVGRGDTARMFEQRESARAREMTRRPAEGGSYQLMATEAPPPALGDFKWDNLKRVFGEDPRVWTYLLPTMAPQWATLAEAERAFGVAVGESVEKQLRSAAHVAREGEDEAAANPSPAALAEAVTAPRGGAVRRGAVEGGAVGRGEQQEPPASALGAAESAAAPRVRPTIQRIPFFSKHRAAPGAVGDAEMALAAEHRAVEEDPLERYNQPTEVAATPIGPPVARPELVTTNANTNGNNAVSLPSPPVAPAAVVGAAPTAAVRPARGMKTD